MIALEDRQRTSQWLEAARRDGARLKLACEVAGIDARTVQRWIAGDGLERGDGRPQALRPACAHALSVEERQRILDLANEPRFAELPPARIVPMLADEGTYIAYCLKIPSSGRFSMIEVEHSTQPLPALYSTT